MVNSRAFPTEWEIPFAVPTQDEHERTETLIRTHERLGAINIELDDDEAILRTPESVAPLWEEREELLRTLDASDRHWHARAVPFEQRPDGALQRWPHDFRGTGRKCVLRDPREIERISVAPPGYLKLFRRRQTLSAVARVIDGTF